MVGGGPVDESVVDDSQLLERAGQPLALTEYLRIELDRAWASEEALKTYICKVAAREEAALERVEGRLLHKEACLRAELERWMMRAEELEMRLLDSQQRCCELKGLARHAQKQINYVQAQKEDAAEVADRLQKEMQAMVDFLLLENESKRQFVVETLVPTGQAQ